MGVSNIDKFCAIPMAVANIGAVSNVVRIVEGAPRAFIGFNASDTEKCFVEYSLESLRVLKNNFV